MFTLKKRIRKLNETDISDAMELYAETCRYDEYFQKLFGKKDCKENIRKDFLTDVASAIELGLCLGLYEKDKLIGCLFSIDWWKYYENEHNLFEHMFNMSLDTTQDLIGYMGQFSNANFIFAIGIADGKRCQGNATALIQYYCKAVGKDTTLVTDCLYPLADSMWLSNSFIKTPIDNTVDNFVMVKLSQK